MTASAVVFLTIGCIILYGGLLTTIGISIKNDK